MKTLLNITCTTTNSREERTISVIRPSSAPRPTQRGAERIAAREINGTYGCSLRPSDVSVSRIEEAMIA